MEQLLKNLRIAQLHCVKILEAVDEICRRHEIQYSLTGGSVIGYHLYGGFIPWDDDIDIMMTRDNYERFLEIAPKELPENLVVKNYDNGLDKQITLTKVVDENTTVVEKRVGRMIHVDGIFIDIAVFDRVPKNKRKRLFCKLSCKVLQCCKETDFEKVVSVQKFFRNLGIVLCKPFAKQLYSFITGKYKHYSKTQTSFDYAELCFALPIFYEPELFDHYIDVEFEGRKFMIVEDYMRYLELRYGRREFYKQQKPGDLPHHMVYVDCHNGYKNFNEDQWRKNQ